MMHVTPKFRRAPAHERKYSNQPVDCFLVTQGKATTRPTALVGHREPSIFRLARSIERGIRAIYRIPQDS